MLTLMIICFVVNVVFNLSIPAMLPDTPISTHFDSTGRVDGVTNPLAFGLMMVGVNSYMFVLLLLIPWLTGKMPPSLISLPNKDYWLAPERKPQALKTLAKEIHGLGVITLQYLFWISAGIVYLNTTDLGESGAPLSFNLLLGVTGVYLLFIVYWCVRLWRAFPKPKE